MKRVAVLGERAKVQGFALAGAMVLIAEDAEQARTAWESLGADVAVVVLTPLAAASLAHEIDEAQRSDSRLPVVMPP